MLATFRGRVDAPREFALANRVLLLYGSSRVPLDVALGAMPFEERCVDRASAFDIGNGQSLVTCSAEDLIVFKAFAGATAIGSISTRSSHGSASRLMPTQSGER